MSFLQTSVTPLLEEEPASGELLGKDPEERDIDLVDVPEGPLLPPSEPSDPE